MPRTVKRTERLTKKRCEELRSEAARYRVSDASTPALKFVVEPNGRKYWSVRFVTADGKNTEKVLGEWPGLLPEAARDDANALRTRVKREGVDPAEAARRVRREAEESRALTFRRLSEAYLTASERGTFSGRNGRKAQSTLAKERQHLNKHVLPKIGARPITQIRRGEIVGHLEDIARKSGHGAANSCLEVIRRVFAYARHMELLDANPALEIPRYALPPRDVVATDVQLKTLWAALEEAKVPKSAKAVEQLRQGKKRPDWGRQDSYASAAVLQLALLTLQRRGEVASIHRDDIDWNKSLWTIPAMNKKERRRGLVPLSPWAVEILREAFAHSGGAWAFAGRNPNEPIDPKTVTRFMARLRQEADIGEITPHDLRRTGRTRLTSDELGIDEVTAERVLNHVVGSRQQLAYDWQAYVTQKRAALDAWSNELRRIVKGEPPPSNVVAFQASAEATL